MYITDTRHLLYYDQFTTAVQLENEIQKLKNEVKTEDKLALRGLILAIVLTVIFASSIILSSYFMDRVKDGLPVICISSVLAVSSVLFLLSILILGSCCRDHSAEKRRAVARLQQMRAPL